MNLEEYIKNAIRTETYISEIKFDKEKLLKTMEEFIRIGNLLDEDKKYMFYKKPPKTQVYDTEKEEVLEINRRILHAIIGIATEATELMEMLYDQLSNNSPVNVTNIREECGDINWYQAILYDSLKEYGFKVSWEQDLDKNIEKLRTRYPERFTSENAINRNVNEELKHYE